MLYKTAAFLAKKEFGRSKLKNVYTILKKIKTICQLHNLFIKQTSLTLKSKLKTKKVYKKNY